MRGYAKEIAAKREATVYRRDGERGVALAITEAGRPALRLSATKALRLGLWRAWKPKEAGASGADNDARN